MYIWYFIRSSSPQRIIQTGGDEAKHVPRFVLEDEGEGSGEVKDGAVFYKS
jgi:hypothetical protein